ncbi:hypothetical protein LCGC14_0295060 [marine sediment metagenome]|uniref:Cohesin domain-containing protein n=1 Tax=marine sediment metagenome TaxID=412755 RepID=A0A0F9WXW8_9ZZZZ
MPGFEPQTDIGIVVVPLDAALETTPTVVEVALLGCPVGANMQIELLSVGFRTNTLPVDSAGTGTILVDIEFIDSSGSPDVSNLLANYDVEAATVLIYNSVWRGSQIMEAGDVINAEVASDGTHNTASEGAALIVEYRVLRHS